MLVLSSQLPGIPRVAPNSPLLEEAPELAKGGDKINASETPVTVVKNVNFAKNSTWQK